MKAMQVYVRAKKERASLENSFQICDFRKLCPDYKYGKADKRAYLREVEDRIPLLLAGDKREIAQEFAAYLRDRKINLKWTGIQNNYSETGATYGESKGICYVGLADTNSRGNKDGWHVSVTLANLDHYEATVMQEGLQDFIWNHIFICDKTVVNACNGGEKSIYACHRGKDVVVMGKEVKYVCRIRNQSRVSVHIFDPDVTAISHLKRLIELEQAAIKGS